MIGFLRGEIDSVAQDYCLLDCGGVGYRIFVPESTRSGLVAGGQARLHISMQVREDAILLFGFATRDEYELYLLLLGVNGVGPKLALAVLSSCSAGDFRRAIAVKDINVLTRIPGVGKKTAERMVVELKDRVGQINDEAESAQSVGQDPAGGEALLALQALGYSRAEVVSVLRKIDGSLPTAMVVKLALREFLK